MSPWKSRFAATALPFKTPKAAKGGLSFPTRDLSLARQQAFALQTLPLELAVAADRFRPLARTFFGWFFVMAPEFHLAEDAFPLHLLFQRFKRLVDIVVANDDLQARLLLNPARVPIRTPPNCLPPECPHLGGFNFKRAIGGQMRSKTA